MGSEQRPFVPKTPMDFQKMKLDRLMANPDKPVVIPDTPRAKKGLSVPEFVRNVMGSSAGAGSGEFHVYRHLRRKEYTRQKMIDEQGGREKLDDEYRDKLEENKRKMEDKTAKNRAKRLKKKANRKLKKGKAAVVKSKDDKESETESDSDEVAENIADSPSDETHDEKTSQKSPASPSSQEQNETADSVKEGAS